MMSRDHLQAFLAERALMTLSVVSESGVPQSALVAYADTLDLELIVRTSNTSRKYAALAKGTPVAAVIGWDKTTTVQYEGMPRELGAGDSALIERYVVKNTWARRLVELPDSRFFVITPSWARMTDISGQPWDETEFTF